ncbi:MAG: N-acetylmuramic acid 6-phosphate etherase [Oscillospiraceae bacterium]|nr:N-acetylmuramic acid 6-phosphate etherase [Oscillospiraceae bacterium]
MGTESRNPRSMGLSDMGTKEILRLMNEENENAVRAVEACLPEIAALSDLYAEVLRAGGRVFYLGAGTSGGLALLDAAEMPPTFSLAEDVVIALPAEKDMRFLTADEDDPALAARRLAERGCSAGDLVIGIAASGSTPYVAEGLRYARSAGAKTAAVACNPGSLIGQLADVAIEADTGPEVLTGSTRLKAGNAQKMILNMISTAAMVKLGKVRSNLMVDMRPTNAKLVRRACSMIVELTGCSEAEAEAALASGESVSQAVDRLLAERE